MVEGGLKEDTRWNTSDTKCCYIQILVTVSIALRMLSFSIGHKRLKIR